ncbi:hypothetical protein [Pedobacter psychrodurus]|uniref:hypothetical protein n=1 Tax=Pedobacter psychrodurus TaxID=2530456 RepID=UPI00103C27C8|nr:hypothetical protein [Pedobacter psychrodurus]
MNSSLREGFFSRKPAPIFGEAIFIARLASMKDCFIVPPLNDDGNKIFGKQVQQQISKPVPAILSANAACALTRFYQKN